MRYLADSNRRPRFCRPIPNHSGKVPFNYVESCYLWLQKYNFFSTHKVFAEFFYAKPRAESFSQFQTNKAIKSALQ